MMFRQLILTAEHPLPQGKDCSETDKGQRSATIPLATARKSR
jgi:hypothetical protein